MEFFHFRGDHEVVRLSCDKNYIDESLKERETQGREEGSGSFYGRE